MRTRNLFIPTLLTVFAICFTISCTKPASNLTNKNESEEKTLVVNDTFKTIYPIIAINKHFERKGDSDTLTISLNNYDFVIYPNGFLKWSEKDSVLLSQDMFVAYAYFHIIGNDLLLFCEMSDNDYGTSDVFRINLTNKQIKWKANLSGFNFGQPVIRANSAYVTAIGSVGKLNLETGKYLYVDTNLYDRDTGAFNNFDTIIFRDSKTYFIAKRPLNSMVDTVILDERTKKMTIKKQTKK